MKTWEFSLIVDGPKLDIESDEMLDALASVCDDQPLVGRTDGLQEVTFARQATTLEDAVATALADLGALAGLTVTGIRDESFISATDIANRSQRSLDETLHLIARGQDGVAFPSPVSSHSHPARLWYAPEVSRWFAEHVGEQLHDPNAESFAAMSRRLAALSNTAGRTEPSFTGDSYARPSLTRTQGC